MAIDLTNIAEVQTLNVQLANQFLNKGYVLLGIFPTASIRSGNDGNNYQQAGVTFVVGRDDSTEHFEVERTNAR